MKSLTFDDVALVPQYSSIETRDDCNISTNLCNISLAFPVIPSNMETITGYNMLKFMSDCGGIGILHRFGNYLENIHEAGAARLNYGISVGYQTECELTSLFKEFDKIQKMQGTLPSLILIDVAHGHHIRMKSTIELWKKLTPNIPIVAGNACTIDGANDLGEWGANAIKVGVGNGSACETRVRTGVGVPQFTALEDICNEFDKNGIHGKVSIISDGGVKSPGDVAKALAVGANVVMSGSLFAATKETPTPLFRKGVWPNERLYKPYYGSASEQAKGTKNVEGNGTLLPYKGKAMRIVEGISQGIKSCMSYCNARTLEELFENAIFTEITQNGIKEARPYILEE